MIYIGFDEVGILTVQDVEEMLVQDTSSWKHYEHIYNTSKMTTRTTL
jgi:hypothetical protein